MESHAVFKTKLKPKNFLLNCHLVRGQSRDALVQEELEEVAQHFLLLSPFPGKVVPGLLLCFFLVRLSHLRRCRERSGAAPALPGTLHVRLAHVNMWGAVMPEISLIEPLG